MPDPTSRIPSPTEVVELADACARFFLACVTAGMPPDAATSALTAFITGVLMRERGVPQEPWEPEDER